jgi:adenosylmethionine-8-amino-7-oxononanoate aminotransferase
MELVQRYSGELDKKILKNDGYLTYTNKGPMIDLMAGNSAYMWGYNFTPLKDVIYKQMSEVQFLRGRKAETCDLVERVNSQLIKMSGCDLIFWAISGSDAVEAGLEIAYKYWETVDISRVNVVGFYPGYNGCTFLEKSLRGERRVNHVELPVSLPFWENIEDRQDYEDSTYNEIENLFETNKSVGAIVMESIPWLAGIRPWSNTWWIRIRALCDQYNVLLILDDVAGCFGKTGSVMTHLDYGVLPDIIVLGKSLTGGYIPSGCALANKKVKDVLKRIDWTHGHTWHPNMLGVACAEYLLSIYDPELVKTHSKKLTHLLIDLKNRNLIKSFRGIGSVYEMVLIKEYDPAKLDDAGFITNQDNRDTLGIIVPFIADDEYWERLITGIELLLT